MTRLLATLLLLAVVIMHLGCSRRIANREVVAGCLPLNLTLETKLPDGQGGVTTIEQVLIDLGAHVEEGRLVDRNGKPIFFFKRLQDYSGVQIKGKKAEEEDRKIKELKKKGTIIFIRPLKLPE